MFPVGIWEIKENSLVIRLQQIEKIEDQQKRYQDLEKEAERKKKGYLIASQKRTEIKEILNKMEQAYLDAQAGVLAADLQDGDAMSGMWFCSSSEAHTDSE